jgi:hypothetical protein
MQSKESVLSSQKIEILSKKASKHTNNLEKQILNTEKEDEIDNLVFMNVLHG